MGEGGRVWYRVSIILKLWHGFNVNIYGISSLNCSPSPHLLHLFNPRPTGSHSTGNWQRELNKLGIASSRRAQKAAKQVNLTNESVCKFLPWLKSTEHVKFCSCT